MALATDRGAQPADGWGQRPGSPPLPALTPTEQWQCTFGTPSAPTHGAQPRNHPPAGVGTPRAPLNTHGRLALHRNLLHLLVLRVRPGCHPATLCGRMEGSDSELDAFVQLERSLIEEEGGGIPLLPSSSIIPKRPGRGPVRPATNKWRGRGGGWRSRCGGGGCGRSGPPAQRRGGARGAGGGR